MATKAQITWGALAIAAVPTLMGLTGLAVKGWLGAEWQVLSGQITTATEALKRVETDVETATRVAEGARDAATGALTAAATANAAVGTLAVTVEGALETQAERDRAQDYANDLQFGFLREGMEHLRGELDSLRDAVEQRASIGEF